MKQKYILESYDRILKEIKNPGIIFSSDITPLLKKGNTESFLIYRIDCFRQNKKTKYTAAKPVHNLHPKAAKLNFREVDFPAEYKQWIPKILQELGIPENKAVLRGCSVNQNTIYILQQCEIEDLPQEERFFLYCCHKLRNENKKIRKTNKERIYRLKSKEQIEQHIHRKQYALGNLAQRLIKEINPENTAALYQFSDNYDKKDCLKITHIYLEKLLRFIEKEYRNYLNLNTEIPYRSSLVKDLELTDKLREVRAVVLKSSINEKLLKLVCEPLLRITAINIQEKPTYYEFMYCSEFILALYKQISFVEISEETITEALFDLNYNSVKFCKYLIAVMVQELEAQENNLDKMDVLYQWRKNYNQKQTRNFIKYKPDLPSLKDRLISWIEEEIEYLNRKIKLDSGQLTNGSANEEKIKFLTGLSVAQLSCFFALLMETGIIRHKNQADLFRFIAENFKTNSAENISVHSIKSKYYNIETTTKSALREKIIELLGRTKS
ncbi:MAG: hypothetical protein V4572_02520 [Bacteroidota bacterium]